MFGSVISAVTFKRFLKSPSNKFTFFSACAMTMGLASLALPHSKSFFFLVPYAINDLFSWKLFFSKMSLFSIGDVIWTSKLGRGTTQDCFPILLSLYFGPCKFLIASTFQFLADFKFRSFCDFFFEKEL